MAFSLFNFSKLAPRRANTALSAAFIAMTLFAGCSSDDKEKTDNDSLPTVEVDARSVDKPVTPHHHIKNGRLFINPIGPLYKVFNDSNKFQLEHARRLGITPVTDLRSAYFTSRPLVEITTNDHYLVDSLTHSVPFLIPEAARLLDDIAVAFIDSLTARDAYGYRVKVTSLLRTPATVKRLRRVNVNATDSSTHQYATTFDISYTKFHCVDSTLRIPQEDLKNLLAEVLLDFRNRQRCLVKYERKTACFHVTATR